MYPNSIKYRNVHQVPERPSSTGTLIKYRNVYLGARIGCDLCNSHSLHLARFAERYLLGGSPSPPPEISRGGSNNLRPSINVFASSFSLAHFIFLSFLSLPKYQELGRHDKPYTCFLNKHNMGPQENNLGANNNNNLSTVFVLS